MKKQIKIVNNADDLPDQIYEDLGKCHDLFFSLSFELTKKYDNMVVLNAFGSCFTNLIFEMIDEATLDDYIDAACNALRNAIKNKKEKKKNDDNNNEKDV